MAAARIAGDAFAGGGASREAFAVCGGPAAARAHLHGDDLDRSLSDERHIDIYLKYLFLPTHREDGEIVVLAACDDRHTWRAAWDACGFNIRIVACPRQVVVDAIQDRFREKLARDAQFALDHARPELSARHVVNPSQRAIVLSTVVAVGSTSIIEPSTLFDVGFVALALLYLVNIGLRYVLFATGWSSGPTRRPHKCGDDRALPTYSILVPLFREANMMGEITRALRRIDYPGLLAQLP